MSEQYPAPKRANVLITGTPGTGKTTLCELVSAESGLKGICVGELVKQKNLYDGRCDEFDAFYLDEDKVVDEMEDDMVEGGKIVDYHGSDFFPQRWFQLVVVLRYRLDFNLNFCQR